MGLDGAGWDGKKGPEEEHGRKSLEEKDWKNNTEGWDWMGLEEK